ncbi:MULTISPECIES: hypothetical protein [Mycobacterium]|uniref:Uncharacterized protein n=1 Tax=Mycobacterium kiyosense TaxID=2871094 RepID=A0A9P3Q695_9MYCO|nr:MULTISPECIES: hypothetical protein [Mycobacterium]BDB45518.1 hypothetical protein IWGMT90018_59640 [Mycobacterium kiyosense]BDE11148.1 hypothetical protein MKCMC460_00080 [Mycobacterium sp. 20KCMC460]GLB83526.1 hypothetical protein SRL2020028_27820 [Mycobacterium kiyosense]GLB91399.1 hypothetical protein SRL2020130_42160 [Mycobacterium kiyosense]GLB97549.1 hypothetical protein SRL2020226_43250 [Mycobacterium kiyosense]
MVMPYISRLRPTTGLRPRPRSRFEPPPALPIDGPASNGHALLGPPAPDIEPVTPETEFEPEQWSPAESDPAAAEPVAEPMVAPTNPAVEGSALVRPPAHEPDPNHHLVAPSAKTLEPPPRRPAAAPGASAAEPVAVANQPVRAPVAAVRPPATAPPHANAAAPPDAKPAQVTEPAPSNGSPPPIEPPRQSRPAEAHRPAPTPQPYPGPPEAAPTETGPEGPSDNVPALARWQGDLRVDLATTEPPQHQRPVHASLPAPPPAVPPSGHHPAHTDVSVTIGRIEVRAPAADAAPTPRQPAGPRRRPPTLDDYLASRTRARGRAR